MYLNILIYIGKVITFFQSNNPEEDITSVVFRWLKYYRIKVTHTTIREYLKSDPDYPTLKSICDFLEDHSITHYPLKLDESDLYNLDMPFIGHINEKGGKVVLVYSITKKRVIYTDSLHGVRTMSINDFLEKWKGVVILIEIHDSIVEPDYLDKRSDEIVRGALVPFIFLIFCFAGFTGIYSFNLFQEGNQFPVIFLLGVTHVAGLIFSILLFRHELDIKTKFTEKLCHISTNTDCNVVTKSKASKIFGNITWADAGIVYFTGGLTVLFVLPDNNTIGLLTLLSICSLPYPVFSIFYQWLKLRKWCPMCLSVQVILLTEFLIFVPSIRTLNLNTSVLMHALLIYSIVLLVILQMKLLMINEKEKDHLKLNLMKLKRNQELFFQQLQNGERIRFPVENTALVFGDLTSEIIITVFLSAYCSACATKFSEIMNLISKKINVRVHLILSPYGDELSVKLLKVIFLKTISNERNIALELLENWYKTDKKVRNRVLEGVSIPEFPAGFDEMISYNTKLFQIGNIKKVPNVYVNGFPLPAIYSLEDIRYHINVLKKTNKEHIKIEE